MNYADQPGLWRLLGRQAGKTGMDLSTGAVYRRAKALVEAVKAEQPHATPAEISFEVLKRWRVELCTLVLEHGRA